MKYYLLIGILTVYFIWTLRFVAYLKFSSLQEVYGLNPALLETASCMLH